MSMRPPFSFTIPGFGLGDLAARVSRDGTALTSGRPLPRFGDLRIVGVPVEGAGAIPRIAGLPLKESRTKFPEAVLLEPGGRKYGEVGSTRSPHARFVKMKNRLFSNVFGNFRRPPVISSSTRPGSSSGSWSTATTALCSATSSPRPAGCSEASLSREAMGKKRLGHSNADQQPALPLQ